MTTELPARPDLGQLRGRAKDLRRAVVGGNPAALTRIESRDLLEQIGPHSPLADRERLLYAAYASTYHWLEAGNLANHARGEHLIASVAVRTGEAELALMAEEPTWP